MVSACVVVLSFVMVFSLWWYLAHKQKLLKTTLIEKQDGKQEWVWCKDLSGVPNLVRGWVQGRDNIMEVNLLRLTQHTLRVWKLETNRPEFNGFEKIFKGIVHQFFFLLFKSHILNSNGVWYSWFWPEVSINAQNSTFLGFHFVPRDLDSRRHKMLSFGRL